MGERVNAKFNVNVLPNDKNVRLVQIESNGRRLVHFITRKKKDSCL